jgi:uncharacterized protein (UPF0218 family)
MISIEQDLHLPEELRDELKKPFGVVMESSEIARLYTGARLITIGDTVSTSLIKEGLKPSLIIWDGKVKRRSSGKESRELLDKYAPSKEASNPPGSITKEAWDLVISSLRKDRASILVSGEEDLLTIPIILNAEEGTWVVYGYPPDKGAILIIIDRKIRAVFQDILSRFKK